MTKQVQIRRGTTAQHAVFTGAEGELTFNTDTHSVVAHNGITTGGYELARADFGNVPDAKFGGIFEVVGVNTLAVGNSLTEWDVKVGHGNTTLIVDGSQLVTGIMTVGGPVTIEKESTIIGGVDFAGIRTETTPEDPLGNWHVSVGKGYTAFVVDQDAYIGGIATVTETRGTEATFNKLTVTSFGTTTFTLETTLTADLGIGTNFIGLAYTDGVQVGDYVSIGTAFNDVQIVGFASLTIPEQNLTYLHTSISTTISAGSTIIGLSTQITEGGTAVSVGNSISLTGYGITNVAITGVGLTITGVEYNQEILETSVREAVGSGATIVPLPGTGGISIGNSFTSGSAVNLPIVGLGTTSIAAYNSGVTTSTAVSLELGIGATVVYVDSTALIAIGNSATITEVGTQYFVDVPITGVGNTFFTIPTGSEAIGTVVVPVGSVVAISTILTDSEAVILGTNVGTALTTGAPVSISTVTADTWDAISIGVGDTIDVGIATGTLVSISTVTTVGTAVTIGIGSTSNTAVAVGDTGVTIRRYQDAGTTINVDVLNTKSLDIVGIMTLNGLTFPTEDGKKGQVLTTDGEGNIGFSTGSGAGGSQVLVYVSQATGDDLNDGRTLPVKTIKRGAQIASFLGYFYNTGATILVESGDYIEENPIILYDNVNIIADSLRNVVVRPKFAGGDLFKVRNGCYITGLTLTDLLDEDSRAPQHTFGYSISFDEPFNNAIDRTGYAATGVSGITSVLYEYTSGITTIITDRDHELYPGNTVRLSGLGFTCGYDEAGITTFKYDHLSGVATITSYTNRNYAVGNKVFLHNLPFSCSEEHAGITTTIFPDGTSEYGYIFEIVGINSAEKTFSINAGISTIAHTYEGWGRNFVTGCEYTNSTGIATITVNTGVATEHGYLENDMISLEGLNFSCVGYTANPQVNISNVVYNEVTGIVTVTTSSAHLANVGGEVKLGDIEFACSGYTQNAQVNITSVDYNEAAGICTITTDADHGGAIGKEVTLAGIEFSCDSEHAGVTSTTFPYEGSSPNTVGGRYDRFIISGINSATQFEINAGITTIAHTYVSGGTAQTGITSTTFPYPGSSAFAVGSSYDRFVVTKVNSSTEFEFHAGISTIAHTYVSGGYAQAGITTTVFPDGTAGRGGGNGTGLSADGFTFKVAGVTTNTFTIDVGISTIAQTYVSGGTAGKIPTVQKVNTYPEENSDGRIDFGVFKAENPNELTIRAGISTVKHYYTQGGDLVLSKPLINKSPYIQNCSILSSLGGNGILVDGDKVLSPNIPPVQGIAENPPVGDTPEFGKSMVAATFTMISFDGIGWRVINDGYSQVVSCFQIFCRYGSLAQSGGYLSITNSATNFGDIALRATGFSPNAFAFDKGRVAATGTSGGLQTLKCVGFGRSDQDLYVLRFLNDDFEDKTSTFKPIVQEATVNPSVGINTSTDLITIVGHPFQEGDSVVYLGNEQAEPQIVINGLVSGNIYYVQYIDSNTFRLYEDESQRKPIDLRDPLPVGINTFQKNNQEFIVDQIISNHNIYQELTLVGASTAFFQSGSLVTQNVSGGQATGYALTYHSAQQKLVVSVEEVGGVRYMFDEGSGAGGLGGNITDNTGNVSFAVTAIAGVSTYRTIEFKVDSTVPGNVIQGIGDLPTTYRCHLHRPSIVNSSAHTWEYSGSGTDYNALPQNGGKGDGTTEQVSELGGRVYASGTNELGDFKIGTQITAVNRTGNIFFNNKVSIGELDSIRLSLSGGVAVEEFSTDSNLGESELGGPQHKRVSTQLAVRSFLANRLGTFIDKTVSQNAIPNAVVQLNSSGQINADLIPPKIVNYTRTVVGNGKTVLANQIPPIRINQGDTVVEPENSFVLVNDTVSQYLILDSNTADYNFNNGDEVVSALASSAIGVVTTPPNGIGVGTTVKHYTGYGQTGLVKGVLNTVTIQNAGSGYSNSGIYSGVPLVASSGVGVGASAIITVSASGTVIDVDVLTGGKGYEGGDILTASDAALGGRSGGAAFTVQVGSNVETRLYLKLTNFNKFVGSSVLSDYIADGNAVGISTTLDLDYNITGIDPTSQETGGDIDFANDRIVVGVGHALQDGDVVKYTTNLGTNIAGIVDQNSYYVKRVGLSSVELHTNYLLSDRQDLTGSGIGTHSLLRIGISTAEDRIHFINHGYSTGDPVRVTGNTPIGINTNAFYYLGSITVNGFTLHTTQADAQASVGGVSFNPVAIGASGTGTITFTEQNVRYSDTVNTSSTDSENWSLLAQQDIDAANIISGTISPSRLGNGAANSDTFLNGNSSYQKVVTSVGIGSTQPFGITASSADYGVGFSTFYGQINLTANRVQSTLDLYSTTGVAKFKSSTFSIGTDGEVQIKTSATGDVDAAQLGGQTGAYYLALSNATGVLPISKGGTGNTGAPANGALLVGNGSAYNLTSSPSLEGTYYFRRDNGNYVGNTSNYALQAYSSGNNAAGMSFHKGGYYAVNMGLDSDNVFRIGGWSASANRWELTMGGDTYQAGNVYAYRFYDRNNTGYYMDPAGTSNVSSMQINERAYVGYIDFKGTGSNSGYSTRAYSIYQEEGGWGYPYPDLRIAYHTGIKLGANAGSYEGTRVYTDYNMSDLVVQLAGPSNYTFRKKWMRVDNSTGIYSDTNGAHIYPNPNRYGSWRIDGNRNGWWGLGFEQQNMQLMMNYNSCGIHRGDYGWQFHAHSGRMYVYGNYHSGWSDARLKENIRDFTGEEAIEKISQLRTRIFNWNAKAKEIYEDVNPNEEVGFVAQELQEVLPDLVVYNKSKRKADDEEYLTITWDRLIPYAIGSINNLRERVESLEEKVSKLIGE